MEEQKRSYVSSVNAIAKKIDSFLESLLGGVFAFIFLLCCITVVLRYVFNTSIFGSQEIGDYLFIYMSAMGAGLLIQNGEHIRVDFFTKRSVPVRKALMAFQHVVVIALQVFLMLHALNWIDMVGGFLTPLLHIEQRWVQYAIPVCMILSILFSLFKLMTLFSKETILGDGTQ